MENQTNNEQPQVFKPASKSAQSSSFNSFESKKTTRSNGFGRNIVVPFLSGIVGASLVVGLCFRCTNKKKLL